MSVDPTEEDYSIPDDVRREYQESIRQKLADIGEQIEIIRKAPASTRAVCSSLLTIVHKIRGSASWYGYDEAGRIAGDMEDLLTDAADSGKDPAALAEKLHKGLRMLRPAFGVEDAG